MLKSIEEECFLFTYIDRIVIPASVTKIGYAAFVGCRQLKDVEIPKDSKLQIIENEAFSCTAIESIFIPSSVIEIGKGAFDKSSLQKVDIPKFQTIGKYAFRGALIETINIPPTATNIDEEAFVLCKNLKTQIKTTTKT